MAENFSRDGLLEYSTELDVRDFKNILGSWVYIRALDLRYRFACMGFDILAQYCNTKRIFFEMLSQWEERNIPKISELSAVLCCGRGNQIYYSNTMPDPIIRPIHHNRHIIPNDKLVIYTTTHNSSWLCF